MVIFGRSLLLQVQGYKPAISRHFIASVVVIAVYSPKGMGIKTPSSPAFSPLAAAGVWPGLLLSEAGAQSPTPRPPAAQPQSRGRKNLPGQAEITLSMIMKASATSKASGPKRSMCGPGGVRDYLGVTSCRVLPRQGDPRSPRPHADIY